MERQATGEGTIVVRRGHVRNARTIWRSGVAAVALGAACTAAGAAEWTASGTLAADVRYNNNLRLAQDNENEAWGAALAPSFMVRGRSERAELRSDLRLLSQRYPGEDNLDTDNAYLDLAAQRHYETAQLGVDVGYDYDTSLTSELEDTGFVQDRKRRERLTAAPNWRWQWTERSAVSAGYSVTDVSYKDAQNTGLYDYDYDRLNLGYQHRFSERNQLDLTLYASWYEAPQRRTEFDDRGIQVGVTRLLSPSFSVNLAVGYRETESTLTRRVLGLFDVTVEDTDEGTTLAAGLEKTWPRNTLSAALRSSVDPSGAGYAVQRDEARLGWDHELTERTGTSLSAVAVRNKSLRDDIAGIDRDFYEAQARLNWRLLRNLRLSTGYRYRYQAYDHLTGSAEDHATDLRVSWLWGRVSD